MRKVNFDSLTNLKAPESWIENAINVPKAEKKKPIAFLKYSKQIAAVACLVLVSAVCLTVYLTNDRITPPIDPNYNTETQSPQSENSESENYTDSSKDKTTNNSSNGSSESQSVVTTKPNESGTIEPSEKPSPTTKPTESENDKPIVGPTKPEDSIEPSEIPTQPTTKPIVMPTVKPTKPSDKPKPTIPVEPSNPNESDIVYPGAPGDSMNPGVPGDPPSATPPGEGSNGSNNTFYTSFPSDLLADTAIVFCSVEDPDGNFVIQNAQANIYSIQGNLIYVSYELPSSAFTKSGRYICNFYTSENIYICSSIGYF